MPLCGGVALALAVVGGVVSGLVLAGEPARQSAAVFGAPARVTLGPATIGTLSPLYPGSTSDLSLAASNPNPFPVRLRSASFRVAGCRDPSLRLARPLVLPGGTTAAQVLVFTGAVAMGLDASSDCQGQVLSVTLTDPVLRR